MNNIVESESFHDNYIHGISFMDEAYSSDLILDIDHILEWDCNESPFQFLVAPANLTFSNVSSLVIFITKPSPTMESYLGIILDIKYEKAGDTKAKYEIELVGGDYIKFEADGAELQILGKPIRGNSQSLSIGQRSASNKSSQPTR